MPEGIALVLLVAAAAAVVGIGLGIVILAPRIGRLLDRAEPDASPEGPPTEDPNGQSPAGS